MIQRQVTLLKVTLSAKIKSKEKALTTEVTEVTEKAFINVCLCALRDLCGKSF